MAWKKFTPTISTPAEPAVALLIPGAGSRAVPFVSIDAATIKRLGWEDGDPLQLLIGEDEDEFKIWIEPMAGEPTMLRVPSKKMKQTRSRVLLGDMPILGEDEFKGAVGFEIVKTTNGGGERVDRVAARRHRPGGAQSLRQVRA